jgi:ribosome-associated protein
MKTPELPLLINTIAKAIFSKKGQAVLVLDMRKITDMTDYFVLCCGDSGNQLRAIRDAIKEEARKINEKHFSYEEGTESKWILMDYVNVVVHIFDPATRAYYSLERLWGDALSYELRAEDYD